MNGYIEAQRAYDRQEAQDYWNPEIDEENIKYCDYDSEKPCNSCMKCYGIDDY